MPQDKHGQELKVGDVVFVRGVVTAVRDGRTYDTTIEPVEHLTATGTTRTQIFVSGRQVVKFVDISGPTVNATL